MRKLTAREKRPGYWECRTTIQGKQRSFCSDLSAEDAVTAARLALAADNPIFQSEHPTLSQFAVQSYLPTVAHHSDAWKEQILWAMKHIGPRFGNVPIDTIDRRQVQAFLSGKMEGKDKLRRSSVGHIRKVLHAIMDLAENDDIIARNPVAKVKLAPSRRPKVRPYTIEEVALLLKVTEGYECHNAIYLAATCGLAKDEALGVKWSDIEGDTLRIERQGTKDGMKTSNRFRAVPICQEWVKGLERGGHRVYVSPERSLRNLIGGFAKKGGKGQPLPARGFHRAIREAGLRYVPYQTTFHSLRKTFSTELEKSGCPEGLIAAAIGHQTGRVTRLYVHDDWKIIRSHAETVQRRLLEARDKLGTTSVKSA